MTPQTQFTKRAKRILVTLFIVLIGLLLTTNIILGSELIRALPGILSGKNIAMPRYLSYLIMGAITLLELLVFTGIIDVEDGVNGLVEWAVVVALWVVLPFDIAGNVFGVVLGNAPISEAMERVTSNMFRFVFIYQGWSAAPDIWAQLMIVGQSIGFFVITLAILGLAVLIGAGPEFFIGKAIKLYFPRFVSEMKGAFKFNNAPTVNPAPDPHSPQVARPMNPAPDPHSPQVARPVNPAPGPHGPQVARPVNPAPGPHGPQAAGPNRPPMPVVNQPRRNNE